MNLEATPGQAMPDWSSITEDILCPLCEYNLRGVSEPRCPECGYRFEWQEVLDPGRRQHTYLFEHHASNRVRWFRKTVRATLRPGQFWRALHPVQMIHPGRLVLYALIVAAVYILSVQMLPGGLAARQIQRILEQGVVNQAAYLAPGTLLAGQIATYGSLEKYKAYLESRFPTHVTLPILRKTMDTLTFGWSPRELFALEWPLLVLLWPAITLAALSIFRISMRRARIRTAHVLRCVVYSFDAFFWVGLLNGIVLGVYLPCVLIWGLNPGIAELFGLLRILIVAMVGHTLYRLVQAYRLYLRFDHPILTVLASQVIAGLAMLKVYAAFTIDLT